MSYDENTLQMQLWNSDAIVIQLQFNLRALRN